MRKYYDVAPSALHFNFALDSLNSIGGMKRDKLCK